MRKLANGGITPLVFFTRRLSAVKRTKSIRFNIILNVIRQCCNILFPLITYPYISRVLGATNLGKYSFADSIIQYFMIVATLGVTGYAVREGARIRDDKEKLVSFSAEIFGVNIISLVTSLLIMLASIFFVPRLFDNRVLLLILSLNIVFTVIGREWVNLIYEDVWFVTLRYIVFQVLALVFLFAFVKDKNDYVIYTWIMVFSISGAQIINVIRTNKYVPLRIAFTQNTYKHIKPIMFMFCISAATVIYVNSDVTILGILRSESEVGIYYMVGKIYTLCKTLLNAIITVITPRVAYYIGIGKEREYKNLLNITKKGLITLIIPCVVGLFMLSDNVISIISSEEFITGVSALRILCVAMLFAVFGCYYSQVVLIPNRCEKGFLVATVVSATVNIGLNFIFIPIYGISGAAVTTVVAEIIVFIVCFMYSSKYIKHVFDRELVPVVAGAVGIMFVCYMIKKLNFSIFFESVLAIVSSIIVYVFIQVLLKNSCLLKVIQDMKEMKK